MGLRGSGRRWAPIVGTGGVGNEEPITGPWVEKGQKESLCGCWWLEAGQAVRPHCHGARCAPPTGNGRAGCLCSLPFVSHHNMEMTSVDI